MLLFVKELPIHTVCFQLIFVIISNDVGKATSFVNKFSRYICATFIMHFTYHCCYLLSWDIVQQFFNILIFCQCKRYHVIIGTSFYILHIFLTTIMKGYNVENIYLIKFWDMLGFKHVNEFRMNSLPNVSMRVAI